MLIRTVAILSQTFFLYQAEIISASESVNVCEEEGGNSSDENLCDSICLCTHCIDDMVFSKTHLWKEGRSKASTHQQMEDRSIDARSTMGDEENRDGISFSMGI